MIAFDVLESIFGFADEPFKVSYVTSGSVAGLDLLSTFSKSLNYVFKIF